MSNNMKFADGVFPFGTHVYREPHQDQEELMADLPLLKKLGFNMIKVQESWAIDEPREGEIDLSRIERIIAHAEEIGLGVYLGLTMEQAPAWMWRKYPDCRLVYADGRPHNDPIQFLLPADGKPGPCWDHPGARASGQRFIAELACRLGRFDNIWAWNTWQEIGFWPNDGGVLGFCYCPYTLTRFREWLKDRYGGLHALNSVWNSAYGDWEEVEPPRRAPETPPFIDWRYFMNDVYMVRALEWKTQALKENDPKHRPVFSHVGSPVLGSGAEWRWAKVGDFFGNSNYPAWWGGDKWNDDAEERGSSKPLSAVHEIWEAIMMRGDITRSATGKDRVFWGAEFQGGPVRTGLYMGRTPTAEDIRRWVLAGLAAGMNGISFWNHRCERFWSECNGFGLLDPQGETTERIEEAGRIARAIAENPEVFSLGETPRAEVAILINEDLYHFCQGTGDHALKHLQYSIRGHYYRLWKMGIAADFVEAEEVVAGALDGYKVAVLPVPLALDASYFSHLKKFVKEGGMLISEACPGRYDKYGFCPRAQMVEGGEELFGTRHKAVRIVREPGGETRWTPPERGYGDFAAPTILEGAGRFSGIRLRASFYLQTLTLTQAEPLLLAKDEIAGAINAFGKGCAVLLGTFAGHSALAHRVEAEGLFERLMELGGVQPDRCGALLRRRRVLGDREAWLLINPGEEEVLEEIALDHYTHVQDLLDDAIVARSQSGVTVRVPSGNLCCLLVS